ncbi:MAG: PD-(D/E)XK nuclease family protein [Rhizobiales bacterium]|nr:PD-(D/E)XK nuclease family protein [Hyphomicrobiales bacterium]
MDRPDEWKPAAPPAPTPPLNVRPRQLSVSRIETLIRDPYSIYARYILRLSPLDPLDAGLDARERGNWIHKVLSEIGANWPDLDEQETARLLSRTARAELKFISGAPETKAVLMSRFDRLAPWFASENKKLLKGVSKSFAEIDGEIRWMSPGGEFILNARADRIDLYEDGRISIYDYKTGTAPSAKQEQRGFSPQLLLEGAIALTGGFSSERSLQSDINHLAYIELAGRQPPGKIKYIAEDDPGGESLQALDRLKIMIEKFDDETRPYFSRPHPTFTSRYGDYDQLARVQEWSSGENRQ